MVTYAQLLNMDTSKLSTAAETAGGLSSSLSSRGQEVHSASSIPPGMWNGSDAAAAGSLLGRQPTPLYDASDAFQRGQSSLAQLVDDLDAAKEHLHGAHDLVAGTPVIIHGDGSVVVPPLVMSPAESARYAQIAQQAREVIDQSLQMAATADETASQRISASPENGDGDDGGDGDGGDSGGVLDWLNGGWRDDYKNLPGYENWAKVDQWWESTTSEEWEQEHLGGLITVESEHGGDDGLSISMPWDGENFGLAVGGDPEHSLKVSLPSESLGPVNASLGSVEMNDSWVPGIGWETDDDGKTKLTPKISLPGVSFDTPGVGVDVNETIDLAQDAGNGIKDLTGKIPGTPW